MPTYDYFCPECDEEIEVLCSIAERDNQTCGVCDGKLVREFRQGASVIGATHSRPIDFGRQLGKKFETNAAAREHAKQMEAQGYMLVDKGDSTVKKWNDDINDSKDRKAKKRGYRDERHRQQTVREEKAKGASNRG